jgi:hypothetical protein
MSDLSAFPNYSERKTEKTQRLGNETLHAHAENETLKHGKLKG